MGTFTRYMSFFEAEWFYFTTTKNQKKRKKKICEEKKYTIEVKEMEFETDVDSYNLCFICGGVFLIIFVAYGHILMIIEVSMMVFLEDNFMMMAMPVLSRMIWLSQ